jgi:hypothetical protein
MRGSVLALGVVLTSVLIGCGGGGDDITRADFVKRANAICAKTGARFLPEAIGIIAKGAKKPGFDTGKFGAISVSRVLAPGLQAEADQIRALGVPSGDETQVNAILDALQKLTDEAKAAPARVAKAPDPYAKVTKLAAEYGLTKCPQG